MLRFFYLSMTFLTIFFTAYSQTISEGQALQIASTFMPDRHFELPNKSNSLSSGKDSQPCPYYIFNDNEGSGFVIVSGDERTEPVLGYSRTASLHIDDAPENVRWWLDMYQTAIENIQNSDSKKIMDVNILITEDNELPTIEPLIKSHWKQGSPFNDKCPLLKEERCVAGCVATAVAQIMNYYHHPISSKATYKYKTETNKIQMPALPAIDFDWNNILDVYDSNSSDAEKEAVATLLLYCGSALSTDYGVDGSGADSTPVCDAMEFFFGYDENIKKVYRSNYSSSEWEELLYRELSKAYPIFYSGQTKNNSGHAFVCDGYERGFFHINWGWGGYCDGHFKLSVLYPYADSFSEIENDNGYAEQQMAVVNIVPKDFNGFDTGIYRSEENNNYKTATWYTINGMQLNDKPTTKGVYLFGGKKMVIK